MFRLRIHICKLFGGISLLYRYLTNSLTKGIPKVPISIHRRIGDGDRQIPLSPRYEGSNLFSLLYTGKV